MGVGEGGAGAGLGIPARAVPKCRRPRYSTTRSVKSVSSILTNPLRGPPAEISRLSPFLFLTVTVVPLSRGVSALPSEAATKAGFFSSTVVGISRSLTEVRSIVILSSLEPLPKTTVGRSFPEPILAGCASRAGPSGEYMTRPKKKQRMIAMAQMMCFIGVKIVAKDTRGKRAFCQIWGNR